METITFSQVLPCVFTSADRMQSDVWQRQVVFRRGETYLIEAESGKGKSTFCSYILGFRKDYSGHILFDDMDVSRLKMSDWTALRRFHVSHLFQELRLFPELTAMENILLKNNLTSHKTIADIESWFHILGISEKMNAKIGKMSFGQQQRVAMIRALCQPFDFIIADEPISHLDDQNAAVMGQLMIEEAHRQGAGVIVTSIGKHMQLPYQHVVHL